MRGNLAFAQDQDEAKALSSYETVNIDISGLTPGQREAKKIPANSGQQNVGGTYAAQTNAQVFGGVGAHHSD
jgi:hypothetical protein